MIALLQVLDVFCGLCHDCSFVEFVCRGESFEIFAIVSIAAHSSQRRHTLPKLNDLVIKVVSVPLLDDIV